MTTPRMLRSPFMLVPLGLMAIFLFFEARDPILLSGQARSEVRIAVVNLAKALFKEPWEEQAEWTEVAAAPLAQVEAGVVVIDDKMYAFGGSVGRQFRAPSATEVTAYDPATDRWSVVAEMPPVTHAAPTTDGFDVWSAGGFEGPHPGVAVADVRRYDARNNVWEAGPPLPHPVAGGALVRHGRNLHYFGGFLADRDTTVGEHWVLSLNGGTKWEPRAPLPIPGGHLSGVLLNGKIYAIGGQIRHDTNPVDVDAVHAYDPETDIWTQVASLPTPRSHFEPGTFVHEGQIIIVGGRNNQRDLVFKRAGVSAVTAYDPDTDTWTDLPRLPRGLLAPAARVIGDKLVVALGSSVGARDGRTSTYISTTLLAKK